MKKRILIVEDDPMVADLVAIRLDLAEYHTTWARNGQEALSRIPVFQPNALILDLDMPILDGFGVLESLALTRKLSNLPVMVLTARHGGDDVSRAIRLGARDYLTKPFKDSLLLMRVARLLRAPINRPVLAG